MVVAVRITLICLPLFIPVTLTAQEGSLIRLEVEDGGGRRAALVCGVHSLATYGFDEEFREYPLPPPPPIPTLELRFLDPHGRKQHAYEASKVDIRQYSGPSQIDTFHIRYQADHADYPLVMMWGKETGERFRRASVMLTGKPGSRVNMVENSAFTVERPGEGTLMLILSGPRASALPMPIDIRSMMYPGQSDSLYRQTR